MKSELEQEPELESEPDPEPGYEFFSKNIFLGEKFIARRRAEQLSNSAETLVGSGAEAEVITGSGSGAGSWV